MACSGAPVGERCPEFCGTLDVNFPPLSRVGPVVVGLRAFLREGFELAVLEGDDAGKVIAIEFNAGYPGWAWRPTENEPLSLEGVGRREYYRIRDANGRILFEGGDLSVEVDGVRYGGEVADCDYFGTPSDVGFVEVDTDEGVVEVTSNSSALVVVDGVEKFVYVPGALHIHDEIDLPAANVIIVDTIPSLTPAR